MTVFAVAPPGLRTQAVGRAARRAALAGAFVILALHERASSRS